MARTRVYAAALAVGMIVAVAGAAYAASRASGTITVCVTKADGALYKATVCRKGDSTLRWNVRGPTGRAGRNGRNGRNGSTGATGPSGTNGTSGPGATGAAADYSSQEARGLNLFSPLTNILTENLPAGSFVVIAKLNYEFISDSASTSNGFASASCTLSDGGSYDTSNAFQYVKGTSAGQSSEEGQTTMYMQVPLTETAGTTVSVSCTEPSGATTAAFVSDADLDAIQVSPMISKPITP